MQTFLNYLLENVIKIALGGGTLNLILAGLALIIGVVGFVYYKRTARDSEINDAIRNAEENTQEAENRLSNTNNTADDFLNNSELK